MAESVSVENIIGNLLVLQDSYATTYRATITKERHQGIPWNKVYTSFTECESLHEPLLEHVGHLPIIATHLYPHLEHTKHVDLGRTLTMLAIHDIGETVTGDIPSFIKGKDHEVVEREAVSSLLSGEMLTLYEEYEAVDTMDSKFAKSIDSLSPMIHHMSHPEVAADLYYHLNADLISLWERKRHYMEWDNTILSIFDYCQNSILPTLRIKP